MASRETRWAILAATAFAVSALVACGRTPSSGYRLRDSGAHWDVVRGERVFEDVAERYPEYFAVILDPANLREPDLRPLRRDLEANPETEANYAALHAIAIGYFELNYRAHQSPGGPSYLADNFRAAKLLAIPWRAYSEVQGSALRDAILDFFEDAGLGGKLGTRATAGRLARVVESLGPKESQPDRLARIERLTAELELLVREDRAAGDALSAD